jgi:hypothetical protein
MFKSPVGCPFQSPGRERAVLRSCPFTMTSHSFKDRLWAEGVAQVVAPANKRKALSSNSSTTKINK